MLSRRILSTLLVAIVSAALAPPARGQTAVQTAPRDPVALTLAAQSLQALTGGMTLTDLTLQGSVTYVAGSDEESGSATLLASGNLASRVTLSLTNGQRTEIRNGPAGNWIGTDGVEHAMAIHNCWPDADWFYPGLRFQALNADPGLGITYVGLETKNGLGVQHVRSFRIVPNQTTDVTNEIASLSAEDIYLDASSLLPLFLDFNVHPDDDFGRNIAVEIQFSGYQKAGGIVIPGRVQKLFNGSPLLDLSISSAAINSGLPASDFAVQ